MKILIVQDFLRSGGTERQSVLLANAFAAAGHPVTLLTFRPGGPLETTVAPGVQRQALQPFDTGLDWFAPGLTRAAARLHPAIILLMGRMANCYGRYIVRGLRHRRPQTAVVGTMRTGKKLPWLFRRSLGAVRHVVANSHEARAALVRQHLVPPEQISVIHNSLVFSPADVADQASYSRRSTLRAEQGATDTTTVLLCVAMFRPEKNQRELIEIAAGLPTGADWQLWLAGDGPARKACAQLAAAKNLNARVKFPGFHRDPSALYAAADVAVHASWSEALSNFLIEAQAHGLPAVAFEAQGVRECFVPDRTGWAIARHEHEAFRTRLLRLISDSAATRPARAAEARAYARLTFDPERQVAAYLDLLQTLSSRPAP